MGQDAYARTPMLLYVSPERRAELEAQFADDAPQGPPEGFVIDQSLADDAGHWTAMAEAWIKRL